MASGIPAPHHALLPVIGAIEPTYNVVLCPVLFDKFSAFSSYMIMTNGAEKESTKDHLVITNFMFPAAAILEGVKENTFKDLRIGTFLTVYLGNYKKRNAF